MTEGRVAREVCLAPFLLARLRMTVARRVAYVHSDKLIRAADCLPANEGRASLVHSLVDAFSLLDDGDGSREGLVRAEVVEPELASRSELLRFHDERYIGE